MLRSLAQRAASRRQAGHHRPVAGGWPQQGNLRRHGPPRHPLRAVVVSLAGHQAPCVDALCRFVGKRRTLTASPTALKLRDPSRAAVVNSQIQVHTENYDSSWSDWLRLLGARGYQELRSGVDGCEVAAICDRNEAVLARAKRAHSDARLTTDPCEVLTSPGYRCRGGDHAGLDTFRAGQGGA